MLKVITLVLFALVLMPAKTPEWQAERDYFNFDDLLRVHPLARFEPHAAPDLSCDSDLHVEARPFAPNQTGTVPEEVLEDEWWLEVTSSLGDRKYTLSLVEDSDYVRVPYSEQKILARSSIQVRLLDDVALRYYDQEVEVPFIRKSHPHILHFPYVCDVLFCSRIGQHTCKKVPQDREETGAGTGTWAEVRRQGSYHCVQPPEKTSSPPTLEDRWPRFLAFLGRVEHHYQYNHRGPIEYAFGASFPGALVCLFLIWSVLMVMGDGWWQKSRSRCWLLRLLVFLTVRTAIFFAEMLDAPHSSYLEDSTESYLGRLSLLGAAVLLSLTPRSRKNLMQIVSVYRAAAGAMSETPAQIELEAGGSIQETGSSSGNRIDELTPKPVSSSRLQPQEVLSAAFREETYKMKGTPIEEGEITQRTPLRVIKDEDEDEDE